MIVVRIVCAHILFNEMHEWELDTFVQCPTLFQKMRRKWKGKEKVEAPRAGPKALGSGLGPDLVKAQGQGRDYDRKLFRVEAGAPSQNTTISIWNNKKVTKTHWNMQTT